MTFKEARAGAGLSQIVAGERLGISNTTISMWETEKSLPRADLLPKIAALYNCTIEELLGSVDTDAA
ncbi:MAG: helix-turn-helix domain-containing protein [Defluviitaleaceae bacterium]|nr:helix-turn-helix domain-containing protein [Defluviitaleaceae bacterium]MCL2273391.1 helix-turn-helix domain-containing protein [Defluviitaleaceae bacterium]